MSTTNSRNSNPPTLKDIDPGPGTPLPAIDERPQLVVAPEGKNDMEARLLEQVKQEASYGKFESKSQPIRDFENAKEQMFMSFKKNKDAKQF